MALRKMRVTFEIDIPVFLSILANGSNGMKIDIMQDAATSFKAAAASLSNGADRSALAKKLLAAPAPLRPKRKMKAHGNGLPTVFNTLIGYLAKNKDKKFRGVDLVSIVTAIGASKNSASPQITLMKKDGFVKHFDDGTYQITAKGLTKAASLKTKKPSVARKPTVSARPSPASTQTPILEDETETED